MKFYVVRHPLTEENVAGITQGWGDSPLTPQGLEAAGKLGNFFKDKSISIIYASDLGRCVETSEIINKRLNVKIIKTPELREQNYGKLDNTYIKKEEFDVNDHLAVPPGGESFYEMKDRLLNYIKNTLPRGRDRVLIVTHEGCFRAILSEALGISWEAKPCITSPLTIGLFDLKNKNLEYIKRFDL